MNVQDWKNAVADAGCVMCGYLANRDLCGQPWGRVTLHHVREGQGLGQRAKDWMVVGLCKEHHQGKTGWHGLGKIGFYYRYKLDELDLLSMTIEGVVRGLRR